MHDNAASNEEFTDLSDQHTDHSVPLAVDYCAKAICFRQSVTATDKKHWYN